MWRIRQIIGRPIQIMERPIQLMGQPIQIMGRPIQIIGQPIQFVGFLNQTLGPKLNNAATNPNDFFDTLTLNVNLSTHLFTLPACVLMYLTLNRIRWRGHQTIYLFFNDSQHPCRCGSISKNKYAVGKCTFIEE